MIPFWLVWLDSSFGKSIYATKSLIGSVALLKVEFCWGSFVPAKLLSDFFPVAFLSKITSLCKKLNKFMNHWLLLLTPFNVLFIDGLPNFTIYSLGMLYSYTSPVVCLSKAVSISNFMVKTIF